jgi:hypothetical protein
MTRSNTKILNQQGPTKMGYAHGTHRALIFGPTTYSGFGIRHLYTEMQGMKLEAMTSHSINYLQMLIGREEPILESTATITCMEDNLTMQFRTFLLSIKAKIGIKNLWRLKKLRTYDVNTMKALEEKGIKPKEMEILNNWRIYFKVAFLSEICNAEGSQVRENYLQYPETETDNGAESK